jgi:glycosidase
MDTLQPGAPMSLADARLAPHGSVHPSPVTWRDQVLYFLLPDRFSDGREETHPRFDRDNSGQFLAPDQSAWREAGRRFVGGTLRGIRSKLTYLRDLGVTALWIGPIWRQRADMETYHGYAIQHFLDVDPRFGTRQDLRALVDAAHEQGIYVVLDVIYNHTGENWFYDVDGRPVDQLPYRFAPPYPIHGWRSGTGQSIQPPLEHVEDGVWPRELQDVEMYTRAGAIGRWDPESWEDPLSPDTEFRRGDFFTLRDLNLGRDDALSAAIKIYRYWIALSDCDGFRIDTVKHVPWDVSRHFCGAIREYAESIGKENFLLVGEVTGGGPMERSYLDIFGRNIDAVLDIGDPSTRLAGMVKGQVNAGRFFEQFQGHDLLGSHRETGRYHVSILDDHDMVGRSKRRFATGNTIPARYEQVAHAVGTQLTTLGIPCIYYGTEQAFDGSEDLGGGDGSDSDRYIREAMFAGPFGAFRTAGCHFFDPTHPTYRRIAAIARVRNRPDAIGLTLRRGRQYPRETSFLSRPFAFPGPGELVAWSRVLFEQEVLVALNTHGTELRGADVTVDADLHPPGSTLSTLYLSSWSDNELSQPPAGQPTPVRRAADGRSTVRVDLPPAGMVILA